MAPASCRGFLADVPAPVSELAVSLKLMEMVQVDEMDQGGRKRMHKEGEGWNQSRSAGRH